MAAMPHVTLLYGALLTLLVGALGINVSLVRTRLTHFHSDAPVPKRLHFAIRAHGNATEWVPLLVLMMLVLELAGASHLWLHVAGGTLLVGRVLHAVGLLTRLPTSIVGALTMWVLVIAMPVWALVLFFAR